MLPGPGKTKKPAGEMDPLLKAIGPQRSVFFPGHRIRMNVVPMFLNVFAPWAIFVFCCGLTSFWLMYAHVGIAWGLLACVFFGCFLLCATAVWARRFEPEPTWFTYTAAMVAIMAIAGTVCGRSNFKQYSERYYQVADLKVINGIDASHTPGTNVMDAGIFKFAPGNHLDATRTWHFKYSTLYCVAPIITNGTAPASQRYDFWAVGKECCSVQASDFRCGAWADQLANGGIRLTEAVGGADLQYYRLAVQQAESLYDIMAPNPIFLTWSSNPRVEVESWRAQVFKNFLVMVVFSLVVSVFFMTVATCGFSLIGRARSAYDMDIYSDEHWKEGNFHQQPAEFSTRPFQT